MLLFAGDHDDLSYAVPPQLLAWYRLGLRCAACCSAQSSPCPRVRPVTPDFEFWRVLDRGLDTARTNYDVIVIDTPPALSYVTINALMAADGVIMPLPPSALDFASSAQFWDLFPTFATN